MIPSSMRPSRRTVLSAMAAVAGVLAAPAVTRAAPMRIVLGHGAAAGNPRAIAADRFAELVREYSSGAIEVEVAGAARLGDDAAMLAGLKTGALGMSVNSQGAASALVPEIAALGLPFLFPDAASAIAACSGDIAEKLSVRYQQSGLVLLGFWDNGIRHLSNARRPIVLPSDLEGLTFRTPPDPMTVDIFEALGAATVQMPFAKVYDALRDGVVDGQENPLTNIHSAKLYQVSRYISLSAHKWESNPVLIAKPLWDRLDQAGKDTVAIAAAEAGDMQVRLNEEQNEALLRIFRTDPKVEIATCDRDAFRDATSVVYDKWLAKEFGPLVRAIIEAAGL